MIAVILPSEGAPLVHGVDPTTVPTVTLCGLRVTPGFTEATEIECWKCTRNFIRRRIENAVAVPRRLLEERRRGA